MELRGARRSMIVLGLAALAVVALGGSALAGHIGSGVKSYTGCLTNGGELEKIKGGDSPLNPCTGNQVVAHFSGGDITKISATGALTGGGDNGEVTIGLEPEFTLPTGCASSQVAKWNGSAWVCATDSNSTYTAGTGLDLTGSAFSIEPAYRVKNSPDCSSGQFATGFEADGDIQCAAPPPAAAAPPAYAAHVDYFTIIGKNNVVLTLNPPAGRYLLVASVELKNVDDSGSTVDNCVIPGFIAQDGHSLDGFERETFSMTSVINHAGGSISLTCGEFTADIDVDEASLIALRVS